MLSLESIMHHDFQFGPKGFEHIFPSMALVWLSLFNSLKIWSTMNFFPTSPPPLWSNVAYPFVDKRHHTITTSLWLHLKFYIQTSSKIFKNFEIWCIVHYRNSWLFLLEKLVKNNPKVTNVQLHW